MPKKLGSSITTVDLPFVGAFFCCFLAFMFYLVSFSSPYWLVSYKNVYNPFVRMGLWSVCYDRYIHPKDYNENIFTGCYWIFSRIFYTKRFWEFINPRWLIAVQVLFSLGFIFQCVAVICVVLYFLLVGNPVIESTISLYSQAAAAFFGLIALMTFAFKSEDRTWMARPDQNFMGFSFAFSCVMVFYALLTIFFLVLVNQGDKYLKLKNDFVEENEEKERKSRMTYGKSTMMRAPASYFAGTGSQKQALLVPASHTGSEMSHSVQYN